MKRSEMVTRLMLICNKTPGMFDDVCIDERAASKILKQLEELGMKPPETMCFTPDGDQYLGREWEDEL